MTTYDVYFAQINQSRIRVDAENKSQAVIRAKTEWLEQYLPDAYLLDVTEVLTQE